MKALRMVLISVAIGGLIWGSYLLVGKFLSDRQKAANFEENTPRPDIRQNQPQKSQRNYTPEELEKLKAEGKNPTQVPHPPAVPSNANHEAAIQRSLKTVDDINRINQMNQRLMEQQRRTQQNIP